VRTRGTYETKGLAVLVVDADVNLAQAGLCAPRKESRAVRIPLPWC
jgi:hypothetical protein